MAHQEQDREDLLREATALTVRAELATCGFAESVVIGFRSGGAASVFIGADPVYQFNTSGQLRRGYRDGKLIKAVDGRLYEMRRERAEGQVQLLRSELDAADREAYLKQCREHLDVLTEQIAANTFELVGHAPVDELAASDVVQRIRHWLESLPAEIEAAARPNVA